MNVLVVNIWCRVKTMDPNRLNHKIFRWAEGQGSRQCRNWNFKVWSKLQDLNLENHNENPNKRLIKRELHSV